MRKDVKFGLTIGAILLATLAVYVIVLSRGGTGTPGNPDVSMVTSSGDGDAATTPPADNSTAAQTDKTATPAPMQDFTTNTAAIPTPSTAGLASPATQPSSSADSPADWNNLLNHGGQVKLMSVAAPERTETPTLDKPTQSAPSPQVSSDVHPALIDGPATQPSEQMAIVTPPTLSAPIPTVTPPTSVASTSRTHIVARGETFSSIAAAVYGNSRYYTKILAANPSVDPRHMKIGTTLVIPEVGEAEKPEASASASSSTAAPVDPSRGYTVVQGDSLEKIALKLYGDAHMQDKIYDLNKGLIGPDENRLKIGWILKLPQPPTATASVTAAAHQ